MSDLTTTAGDGEPTAQPTAQPTHEHSEEEAKEAEAAASLGDAARAGGSDSFEDEMERAAAAGDKELGTSTPVLVMVVLGVVVGLPAAAFLAVKGARRGNDGFSQINDEENPSESTSILSRGDQNPPEEEI